MVCAGRAPSNPPSRSVMILCANFTLFPFSTWQLLPIDSANIRQYPNWGMAYFDLGALLYYRWRGRGSGWYGNAAAGARGGRRRCNGGRRLCHSCAWPRCVPYPHGSRFGQHDCLHRSDGNCPKLPRCYKYIYIYISIFIWTRNACRGGR